MVICLERGANDLHMVQLMPLPPPSSLLQKYPEWFILLVPAYSGCPEKRPLNDCVYALLQLADHRPVKICTAPVITTGSHLGTTWLICPLTHRDRLNLAQLLSNLTKEGWLNKNQMYSL